MGDLALGARHRRCYHLAHRRAAFSGATAGLRSGATLGASTAGAAAARAPSPQVMEREQACLCTLSGLLDVGSGDGSVRARSFHGREVHFQFDGRAHREWRNTQAAGRGRWHRGLRRLLHDERASAVEAA